MAFCTRAAVMRQSASAPRVWVVPQPHNGKPLSRFVHRFRFAKWRFINWAFPSLLNSNKPNEGEVSPLLPDACGVFQHPLLLGAG
jgi:hypothetical protein